MTGHQTGESKYQLKSSQIKKNFEQSDYVGTIQVDGGMVINDDRESQKNGDADDQLTVVQFADNQIHDKGDGDDDVDESIPQTKQNGNDLDSQCTIIHQVGNQIDDQDKSDESNPQTKKLDNDQESQCTVI